MMENGPYTGYFVQDLLPCDGPVLQAECFNPRLVEVWHSQADKGFTQWQGIS